MNSFMTRGQAQSRAQLREQFLYAVLALTGDTRVLWTPKPTDTTTSLDESLTGRTITHNASIASRLAALGLGYSVSLDGTTQYGTAPDAADLSPGNGTTDRPLSGMMLANVTDTANARGFFAKAAEYAFSVSTADKVQVQLVDTGGVNVASRLQDTALTTQGVPALYSFSYSAATGGATAGNDITIYVNGAVVPSTATNVAYVAMGDKANPWTLAAFGGGASTWMQGNAAFAVMSFENWNASDHWALKKLVNAYFGLSL